MAALPAPPDDIAALRLAAAAVRFRHKEGGKQLTPVGIVHIVAVGVYVHQHPFGILTALRGSLDAARRDFDQNGRLTHIPVEHNLPVFPRTLPPAGFHIRGVSDPVTARTRGDIRGRVRTANSPEKGVNGESSVSFGAFNAAAET